MESRNVKRTNGDVVQNRKIALLVGSLRKKSLTRKVAKALISVAPEHFAIHWSRSAILRAGQRRRFTKAPLAH
jgi:hypothetical protein